MSTILSLIQKKFPLVLEVKDAPFSLNIMLTDRDRRVSIRKDHQNCALANACKRAMHLEGVLISRSVAYLIKKRVAVRYVVPEGARKEILSFDKDRSFTPGFYTLRKPDAGHNLRTKGGHRPTTRKSTIKRVHIEAGDVRAVLFRRN